MKNSNLKIFLFHILTFFVISFAVIVLIIMPVCHLTQAYPLMRWTIILLVSLVPLKWVLFDAKAFCKKWWSSQRFGQLDAKVLGILLGLTLYICLFTSSPVLAYGFPILLLAYLGLVAYRRTRKNKKENDEVATSPISRTYFDVLGDPNPTEYIGDDKLNRGEFVRKLTSHLANPSSQKMTFGINGSWGLGKTSLVKMTLGELKKLSKARFEEIYFESWHYRQPNKLIAMFFEKIRERLQKHCISVGKVNSLIDRLVKSSTTTFHTPFASLQTSLEKLISKNEDERKSLEEILKAEFDGHHLMIFVDDLDRLEKNELHAILRAVRLLSGLPGITFILAYDRELIEKLLFPRDQSGKLATDYLGKIIQQEFSLAIPPLNIRARMLEEIIGVVKTKISRRVYEDFVGFVHEDSLGHLIFELLPTPREIRRIMAATIWLYLSEDSTKKNRYNLIDLFLITIIQYRLPRLYSEMQKQSDLIVQALRASFGLSPENSLYMRLSVEKAKKQPGDPRPHAKGDIKNKLIHKLNDNEQEKGLAILSYLLAPLFDDKNSRVNLEVTVIDRRICGPHVYESYFQYSGSDQLREIDSLINKANACAENLDQFEEEIPQLLSNLAEPQEWQLFLDVSTKNEKEEALKAILLTLAENSDRLSSSIGDVDGKRFTFSYRAYVLYLELKKLAKGDLGDFLSKIVRESASFGFAAHLIKLIIDPNFMSSKEGLHIEDADRKNLEKSLNEKAEVYFEGKIILESNNDDLVALTIWAGISKKIKEKIIAEIQEKPERIKAIVRMLSYHMGKITPIMEQNFKFLGKVWDVIAPQYEVITKQLNDDREKEIFDGIKNLCKDN